MIWLIILLPLAAVISMAVYFDKKKGTGDPSAHRDPHHVSHHDASRKHFNPNDGTGPGGNL